MLISISPVSEIIRLSTLYCEETAVLSVSEVSEILKCTAALMLSRVRQMGQLIFKVSYPFQN